MLYPLFMWKRYEPAPPGLGAGQQQHVMVAVHGQAKLPYKPPQAVQVFIQRAVADHQLLQQIINGNTNYNDLQNYSGNHWKMMVNHVRKHVGDVLDDLQAPEHATRAECVKIIEKRTFELYEKLDPRAYQLACNTRGGKGYGEAGVTLMNALWNNTNEVFSPDVASMGCIQEFDPHCVCTTTSLVNASGIHPMCFPKLPGHMMSKIYAAKEYEKLAVEAAVTGSYHAALEALVANPLVNSYYKAKDTLNELLVAEKEWLPNFADAIAALEKGEEPNN